MIEFKGTLSGAAEKRFWKRAADQGQKYLLVGEILVMLVVLPPMVHTQKWLAVGACLAFAVLLLLMARIPKSKREREAITPNRIYTEQGKIVCVAQRYTERRNIADVKCVRDFGEFYELVFPFGKVSEKFICQKDLLTKGTLEKFEALFGDRIIRS